MMIEGSLSVKAALLGNKREVQTVYVEETKNDHDTQFLLRVALEKNVRIQKISKESIEKIASGKTHGGILAEVGSRKPDTLESVLSSQTGTPFLALVEGVEDPFNLGYIIRSFYSAGCTGLLIRDRNWDHAEATILRSSAGASEYLPIIPCKDLADAISLVKKQGITCYAAMRKDAEEYTEVDYRIPCLIAVGGEMRGLSSSVRKEIEQNVYIPYANSFHNALNAAAACAVLGFEVLRQRRNNS